MTPASPHAPPHSPAPENRGDEVLVYETAVLTGESLGQVEFHYTEDDPPDAPDAPITRRHFVTVTFHPESKNGYQSIAIDSKMVIGREGSHLSRAAARHAWNRLIEMGFHL